MSEMAATRDGYGKALLELGKQNKRVIALSADLGKSTKSLLFAKEFPERHFNVGIAEGDMVCAAAGMAHTGLIPFASTFAIFTERAFEQIRNSIARTNLPVHICGSHAGILTGEDGKSAQCIEDLAVYRSLPNMTVISPADAIETEKAVFAIANHKGPTYLRTARAKTPVLFDKSYKFELGKGVVMEDGDDVVIFATGPLVSIAKDAVAELKKENISAALVNIHTIKPIDEKLILKLAKKTGCCVTAEDHNIIGGLGSAVAEVIVSNHPVPLERVGLRDTFAESGKSEDLYKKYGLTKQGIVEAVKKVVKRK